MTINKIVALILTTLLNLLGFSIADRAAPIDGNYRVVERVIDGDTLVMDSGERVRLIGVDTPEDGALLNAEIIKHGYGFAYTRFPFARMEEFQRLEREAREQGRGLWALKVIDPDFLHPKKLSGQATVNSGNPSNRHCNGDVWSQGVPV